MSFECFAQRLLNPFRGSMHVIRYEAAEAVTADGVHWDIYVTDDDLLAGLERSAHPQVGDIRYGNWSATQGLRRGPRNSSDDFRRLEAMGDMVYDQLTRLHNRIPFPFQDRYELWLLDQDGQLLALLDSAIEAEDMRLDGRPEWHAGYAAHDRFRSSTLQHIGAGDDPSLNAGDYLTRYVNACAGPQPAAQWFCRTDDGGGTGLDGMHLDPARVGRRLAADAFPALLLADVSHDTTHRQLIRDFLDWQAAWLLTLPHLDWHARQSLERQARRQAQIVDQLYRLYPVTVDADAITAARVEARLRGNAASEPPPDDDLPTFYIELGSYFSK